MKELGDKLEIDLIDTEDLIDSGIEDFLDLLISFDKGYPIASRQSELIELVNTFLSSESRHRFAKLTKIALKLVAPSILGRDSTNRKLKVALQKNQNEIPSAAGRIAILLFPKWFDSRR